MNFAIEVPGAASPLSRVELCRVLQSASLHDANKRQAAGQQLSSWESDSEYYPSLQAVFLDNTLPREIRLLAIIQLKNGIDRFWRQQPLKNAIQPAEKHLIRSSLFRGTVDEPDKQLALHNALVIAKIARIDFPTGWPQCLEHVIDLLNSSRDDDDRLGRTLIILLRIVKELGSARLQRSKTALQASTPALVRILCEIYGAKTGQWITAVTNSQPFPAVTMDNSLVAFKILRRLMVAGYEIPHRDEIVRQAWTFSQAQFGQLLPLVNDQYPSIGKHLLQFTKLHLEMADEHPASFCSLPDTVLLVKMYWNLVTQFSALFADSDGIRQTSSSGTTKPRAEGPLDEKLALKGLLLMRSCIKMTHKPVQTIRYRSSEDVKEQKQAVAHLKSELFSLQLIGGVVETIVTRFFLFRKADLDAWEEDPQEWEHQEDTQGNAYEWEVRPCAEKLFMDILVYYGEELLPSLMPYFARLQDPRNSIIDREAIYTAMGLAASLLKKSSFNFDTLLRSTIVSEMQEDVPMSGILRRRFAIFLSQWVPVGISSESRPTIYEIFRRLLDPNDHINDIVVRISAARQFKMVVDDFTFDAKDFLPFAPEVLKELLTLVKNAEVDDTKLAIIETLRSLITRMETDVVQYGDFIISTLPSIWDLAGELGHLMKQAVLAILEALVYAMRTDSQRYQHIFAPLIAQSIQPDSELRLYLMEEALELWKSVLQQSQAPLSADCLNLAEIAITQLQEMNEYSSPLLSIVGNYLILAPETVLSDSFRQPLLKALSGSLQAKDKEQPAIASYNIQAAMTISHRLGGSEGFQAVMRDVVNIGLLNILLGGIRDAYEAHQTSGPKGRRGRLEPHTMKEYFSILARIAVIEPSIFVEMLKTVGPIQDVWNWLSIEWFAAFDTIADAAQLKLNLLGLTRLLELPQPIAGMVLAKLQDYFTMWTSIIVQLWDDDVAGHDTQLWTTGIEPNEWHTPMDMIENEMARVDPVHAQAVHPFVEERLQALAQNVGQQAFQEWVGNVDRDVINSYQKIGVKESDAHDV